MRTTLFSVISYWTLCSARYTWPSPQYDALETFLYEGRRSDGSNMASLQHPCKRRSDTGVSIGAEWLRLAYHDVATHDAEAGTGGLDASIAYELDREENNGHGMNASLGDFESFSNKYISRSDVIAVATTFAVASCGGPILPFRGGRIDALSAGPYGVPEPYQDLQTHTEIFRKQGFSQSEMITLVACGHTLGGVRSTDFPQIVPPEGDLGKPTFVEFDASDEFDSVVVQHYLDGSTKNPLVVHSNQTLTSDLRIFSSDNNATMKSLSSPDSYINLCQTLLEKMLNTVPSNVTLTDEITLLHSKVTNVLLTIEHGQLIFKASLRLTQPIDTTPSKTRIVRMFWCDRYGDAKDCSGQTNVAVSATHNQDSPDISPIMQRLGYYFINYQFVVRIDPSKSVSLFWFENDEYDGSKPTTIDNGGAGYRLDQDRILFVPMSSVLDFKGNDETSKVYHIVAAVRNDTSPSRIYMTGFDSAIPNHGPPLNITRELVYNSTLNPIQSYNFYSTSLSSLGLQLTVDVHAVVDDNTYSVDFQQTYFLGTGTPYTPPMVSNTTTTTRLPGQSSNSTIAWTCSSGYCLFFSSMIVLCGLVLS
ncbi:Putative L-ascorbate peroxidase 6 [Leucoagaricus sp. SymC.cos]|nr:Putative L-ascorbate peroxidase 6 [Leucoagaricus sp. SymC.cos]